MRRRRLTVLAVAAAVIAVGVGFAVTVSGGDGRHTGRPNAQVADCRPDPVTSISLFAHNGSSPTADVWGRAELSGEPGSFQLCVTGIAASGDFELYGRNSYGGRWVAELPSAAGGTGRSLVIHLSDDELWRTEFLFVVPKGVELNGPDGVVAENRGDLDDQVAATVPCPTDEEFVRLARLPRSHWGRVDDLRMLGEPRCEQRLALAELSDLGTTGVIRMLGGFGLVARSGDGRLTWTALETRYSIWEDDPARYPLYPGLDGLCDELLDTMPDGDIGSFIWTDLARVSRPRLAAAVGCPG